MQLHNIKRITKNKKRMTVARGGKRGKTAGRGTKGQKARSGHKIRPEIRDVIKRIPKMRGRGKNSNLSIKEASVVISLDSISSVYKNGEIVSRSTLSEKGLLISRNGKLPQVKILGGDSFDKKVTIKGIPVSGSAKEKIEKAGGAIS